MKRSLPWLRVAIEGLVIVSSILLAFGIDAWWSGRQMKAERELTLALLEDQMRANREILVTGDSLGTQGAARITTVLGMMSPTPSAGARDSIYAVLDGGAWAIPDRDMEESAVESVLDAPFFNVGRDARLNRFLVEFRSRSGLYARDALRFFEVRQRVVDRMAEIAPNGVAPGFPARPDVLLSDFRLANELGLLRTRHQLRVLRSQELLATTDSILALLEELRR